MAKKVLFITTILFSFIISVPCLLYAQQPYIDYLKILKNADAYNKHDTRKIPSFTYQSADDTNLVALRKKYNLDSIAGTQTRYQER